MSKVRFLKTRQWLCRKLDPYWIYGEMQRSCEHTEYKPLDAENLPGVLICGDCGHTGNFGVICEPRLSTPVTFTTGTASPTTQEGS